MQVAKSKIYSINYFTLALRIPIWLLEKYQKLRIINLYKTICWAWERKEMKTCTVLHLDAYSIYRC